MHRDPRSPGTQTPVVGRHGAGAPGSPLVVLLHGRGADERDILSLASHLPPGPDYVAVRGPIALDRGFTWFENRGIGMPDPDSLNETTSWFTAWLDREAPPPRPVVLIGFSAGALVAGALALSAPSRYTGVALLCGALPLDTDIDAEPGRLAGLPVFVAQGERDPVIPRRLLDQAWDYLLDTSGAIVLARRDPVGHTIARTRSQPLPRG